MFNVDSRAMLFCMATNRYFLVFSYKCLEQNTEITIFNENEKLILDNRSEDPSRVGSIGIQQSKEKLQIFEKNFIGRRKDLSRFRLSLSSGFSRLPQK